MDKVSGKLTVFFEEPFWVGVFERVSDGKLSVCKVTFGAEPKDYAVYDFVLKNYYRLRFSPVVATDVKEAAHNPKRVQHYEELQYRGIDPLGYVWNRIWDDIIEYFGDGINFYQNDILELVDIIVKHSWVPDVLIFQYVFSDMYKHSNMVEITEFIDKLSFFLNSCVEKPIYILCNDINLSISYGGGREFFDILESKISSPKIVRKMHFDNVNKDRHFDYGDEYNSNALIFDKISNEIKRAYNPFDSCASAQILIKRDRKK